jgi:transporter family protein
MSYSWILYAGVALVFWGVSGVTQKLATNQISSELSFLWFAAAMIAISLVLMAAVPMHWQVPRLIFWLAVAGGTLNGLGALTSFMALESGGKASIVIALISLFPLVTVAFAVTWLHERLTGVQALGVVLAIVAAILLSLEPPAPIPTPQSTPSPPEKAADG